MNPWGKKFQYSVNSSALPEELNQQSWMLVCILFFIGACFHSFLYWGAFFFLKERADTVVTGLTFNPCYLEDILLFQGMSIALS